MTQPMTFLPFTETLHQWRLWWSPNLHRQRTSVYGYAPLGSRHQNNSLYANKRLHIKSLWQRALFHSEAKGRRLKSLSSSLQKIGLLSEEIVTKTDWAEWKTDSLQSSPVILCSTLASTPIICLQNAPLNSWTSCNPIWFCLFLYMLCLSLCIPFQWLKGTE